MMLRAFPAKRSQTDMASCRGLKATLAQFAFLKLLSQTTLPPHHRQEATRHLPAATTELEQKESP